MDPFCAEDLLLAPPGLLQLVTAAMGKSSYITLNFWTDNKINFSFQSVIHKMVVQMNLQLEFVLFCNGQLKLTVDIPDSLLTDLE